VSGNGAANDESVVEKGDEKRRAVATIDGPSAGVDELATDNVPFRDQPATIPTGARPKEPLPPRERRHALRRVATPPATLSPIDPPTGAAGEGGRARSRWHRALEKVVASLTTNAGRRRGGGGKKQERVSQEK
jgi:hypothetical protein